MPVPAIDNQSEGDCHDHTDQTPLPGRRRLSAARIVVLGTECRCRILDQGDVVTELHAETPGGFDATVGDQADENDLLNTVLLESEVEIGVKKHWVSGCSEAGSDL